jgi:uncharacterized repeat protein (TIGR04076 family)
MAEEKNIKITVLKVFKPEEVFKEPPVKTMKELHPCPIHERGQTFLVYGDDQSEGICGHAWGAIWPYFMMLKNNGGLASHYEDPGVCVIGCPDGMRPVIFKIERLKTES